MVASSNGTLEKTLTAKRPMTAGYRPNLPVGMLWGNGMNPLWRILADIEVMRTHPRVRMALAYYKGAIANAEFEITASDQNVLQFAEKELAKFWETSRSVVQNACEYGWGGFELMYEHDENGFLRLSKLIDFHPTHCWAMTSKREYCGVKVTHVDDSPDGFVYLWGPRRKPAKGFWFAHNPRYSKWYGISQLYAAWRPWSRLARPDGAEEIIDGAIYRHGFQGPLGRYPYGSSPPEEAGGMMKDNANLMMEMLEKAKYGASIALPSTRLDGEYDWEVEFPSNTLNVDGLMNYVDYLSKEIERGIGVPPELIEASETGSGYSGRAIPLEGFFTTQQENAEAIVKAWKEQIGDPLVRWNFGGGSRFEVKVKPLLDSRVEKNKPAAPANPFGVQAGNPQIGGGYEFATEQKEDDPSTHRQQEKQEADKTEDVPFDNQFSLKPDVAKLAKAAAYLLNPDMVETRTPQAPIVVNTAPAQRIVKTETVVRNELGLIERIERIEETDG